MAIETMKFTAAFLGWCMVVNYGILLTWMIFLMSGRIWMYRVHNRWFNISDQEFGAAHYRLMGQFKLYIMIFNLAPYLALRIIA
jgi:hypothetical protein